MKKIIAFWSIFRILIISIPLLAWSIYHWIILEGNPKVLHVLFLATGIALLLCIGFCSFFEINNNGGDYAEFHLFIFGDWSKAVNKKDVAWNWNLNPSEIKGIEIVRLSKDEKTKYTSTNFLFNKYLKVITKYNAIKYIYVSNFSNYQINNIVKLLKHNTKCKCQREIDHPQRSEIDHLAV